MFSIWKKTPKGPNYETDFIVEWAKKADGTPVDPVDCHFTNPYALHSYVLKATGEHILLSVVQRAPQAQVQPSPTCWDTLASYASATAAVMVEIAVESVKKAATEAIKENGKEVASNVLKGYYENGTEGALNAAKAGAQSIAADTQEKATAEAKKKVGKVVNNVMNKL